MRASSETAMYLAVCEIFFAVKLQELGEKKHNLLLVTFIIPLLLFI